MPIDVPLLSHSGEERERTTNDRKILVRKGADPNILKIIIGVFQKFIIYHVMLRKVIRSIKLGKKKKNCLSFITPRKFMTL